MFGPAVWIGDADALLFWLPGVEGGELEGTVKRAIATATVVLRFAGGWYLGRGSILRLQDKGDDCMEDGNKGKS